ncbi:CsgG/HfaB family protein [Sulfurimonas sp.]|uniref:CsgG/HfaB family protein n=1 Tax=Sulfurimonas sp. TaxID=2022749 RepID=UPI003561C015
MFRLFFIISITLFFSGCAQKVYIQALIPANVTDMANNKKVAVGEFKNDSTGLSTKVESNIASYMLNGKKYFEVLNRKNIDQIIKEQKLQSSDLIDEKTAIRVGKIVGAQAIINGQETSSSAKEGKYKEKRKRCKKYSKEKKECVKYEYYTVTCHTTDATLSANINILALESASVIHSDYFTKRYKANSCKNYGDILNSVQALQSLSKTIAYEFVSQLAPKYVHFRVTLLDDIDLDASDEQEKKLENALKYIEAKRMDKAELILSDLLDEFEGQSYVVAYNLAVVKEAFGKYQEAKNLYDLSDEIANEPIDEINAAVIRIKKIIKDKNEAKRQIDAS